MNKILSSQGAQSFEALKQANEHGAEYWSARDLQSMLGYSQWRRFEDAIKRAMTSCETSGNNADYHFAGAGKPIMGGKGAVQVVDDYTFPASPVNSSPRMVIPVNRKSPTPKNTLPYRLGAKS